MDSRPINVDQRAITRIVSIMVVLALIIWACSSAFKSVPAGHVAVATLFGNVRDNPYHAGMHFPVNPLNKWTIYDVRDKTHSEQAGVPSQDQMTTQVDMSVQYRLNGAMAPQILRDTGTARQAIEVHLIPQVRSLLREQGKSIAKAQDFFLEETQQRLQVSLLAALQEYLSPKGIKVEAILIRDLRLPDVLMVAIGEKKKREQEVEKQKAELERYETEKKQMVVMAKAERQAAEEEAKRRMLIADAQAYEITKINEAVASNPAYIQLEALKTLASMSKDPAAKLYFLSGDQPMPLPLMHMGDVQTSKP